MEQIQIDADPQLDDEVMFIVNGGHWLLNVNANPREWQEGLAQVLPTARHTEIRANVLAALQGESL